ncbi:hypothetical protein bpr_II358 (plasmid) [Butyrivibrio proteoclasticus B316]|uniref:Uncharacterized protein n=1 Tax=Butyrivibrio proteoclasticus (strain ATCC 51982 / DSM 14932 / B316) TaxID=515622 RepID=E0S4G3_BUTPB|nr:hypothetical protein [Butyrivibrio proteoclasticus]ADL36295.1 hypothetical protein bpr_II358 [Butyrivibrio proteoclasticus B316]
MGLFSKYKVVNDKEVHRAVMLSLMAMGNVPGAQYFKYKGKLIIAYTWDTKINGLLSNNPKFQAGVNTLADNLPKSYGTDIDIWDSEHKADVPDNILEKTGYVSLYHPENNRE